MIPKVRRTSEALSLPAQEGVSHPSCSSALRWQRHEATPETPPCETTAAAVLHAVQGGACRSMENGPWPPEGSRHPRATNNARASSVLGASQGCFHSIPTGLLCSISYECRPRFISEESHTHGGSHTRGGRRTHTQAVVPKPVPLAPKLSFPWTWFSSIQAAPALVPGQLCVLSDPVTYLSTDQRREGDGTADGWKLGWCVEAAKTRGYG